MRTLPDTIVALDGAHNVIRSYARRSVEKLDMKERDYDELISKQADVFADMLKAAEPLRGVAGRGGCCRWDRRRRSRPANR